MLEALMYISAADPGISQQDIDDILQSAVRNNLRDNITGALIFSGSIFVQILEGETDVLDQVMARISVDPRHDAVTVIAREEVGHRRFASWSMAYRSVHGLAAEELHAQFGWDNAIKKLLDCLPMDRSLSSLSDNIAGIVESQQSNFIASMG